MVYIPNSELNWPLSNKHVPDIHMYHYNNIILYLIDNAINNIYTQITNALNLIFLGHVAILLKSTKYKNAYIIM